MLKKINKPKSFRFSHGHSYAANWTDYQLHTASAIDTALRSTFQALFNAQQDMVQATPNPINFKGNYPEYDRTPPLVTPSRLIECKQPIKPVHADFKRRSAAGEILLSDYHNWTAMINYRPGKTVERTVALLQEEKICGAYSDLRTSAYKGQVGAHEYVFVHNRWYRAPVISQWHSVYYGRQVHPYEMGWSDPTYKYLDEFARSTVDGAKVQEVLADHNSRLLDASTALAEMPETMRSILNAIKTCLRMYREARRKEFRLINKAAEWKNGNFSKRHIRTYHKNMLELKTAIADVWLNFRYNIMPNVYLIEDLLKVMQAKDTLFLRDRSRVISKVTFHGSASFSPQYPEINVTERVLIKSRLDERSVGLNSKISTNLLVTAWELVPLSFIVDWFISVGDFLSSIVPAASAEQGATYSWKVDDSIRYRNAETGCSVEIRFNAYDRVVIDPSQFCAIYYDFDFGLTRQLDAIALTWDILLKRHYKQLS